MDHTAVKAIRDLGVAEVANIEAAKLNTPVIAIPKEHVLYSLEQYQLNRDRFRGCFSTTSIEHFAEYAKRENGASCFVDPENMKAKAFFNLGSNAEPGHGDHTAEITLKKTPEFSSLLRFNGEQLKQKDAAEWLEDWREFIQPVNAKDEDIDIKQAISAVRSLTIEALRKGDFKVGNLSASRSLMESVEARSDDKLPSMLRFTCAPYEGIAPTIIEVRVGVITKDDPVFVFRISNKEKMLDNIAREFQSKLTLAMKDHGNVYIGTFTL